MRADPTGPFPTLLLSTLSAYIDTNYSNRFIDHLLIHALMIILIEPRGVEYGGVDLGCGKSKKIDWGDRASVIGILDRKRLVVACHVREDIGFKYSAFSTILHYPTISTPTKSLTSQTLDPEEEKLFTGCIKFKPALIDYHCSRLSVFAQRVDEVQIYNILGPSLFTDRVQILSDEAVPQLYKFLPHESSKRIYGNKEYFVIVGVSTDRFYLQVKLFDAKTKKLIFKQYLIPNQRINFLYSVELFERMTLGFLASVGNESCCMFYDLGTRTLHPILRFNEPDMSKPLLHHTHLFVATDRLSMRHYMPSKDRKSLVELKRIPLTAIGPIAENAVFTYGKYTILVSWCAHTFDLLFSASSLNAPVHELLPSQRPLHRKTSRHEDRYQGISSSEDETPLQQMVCRVDNHGMTGYSTLMKTQIIVNQKELIVYVLIEERIWEIYVGGVVERWLGRVGRDRGWEDREEMDGMNEE